MDRYDLIHPIETKGEGGLKMNADQAEYLRDRIPARSAPLSPSVISGLVGMVDGLAMLWSGVFIYFLHVGLIAENLPPYLSALVLAMLLTIGVFYFAGLYKFGAITHPGEQVKKIVVICSVVFLCLVALGFALKISAQFSRVWAFSTFFSSVALIYIGRMVGYHVLRKWAEAGWISRNIVIVGAGRQAKRLLERLDRVYEPWNLVLGVFDDRINRTGPKVMEYPVLGTVNDLFAFAREHRVDDVIVSLPWSAEKRLPEIVSRLKELPVHVRLGSDLVGFMYPRGSYSVLGGVTTMDIVFKPLSGWKTVVKYLEDKILATFLLILFAPLIVLIALAIKLDSKGPVLFRQPRYGFNNKVFSVIKFRTMCYKRSPEEGAPQARQNDPRVTRVGRFLRRRSLDELPQLFNVLQGTMSLVGPRPHPVPLNKEYAATIGGYFARHRVKPGITGWAQVNGLRGETDSPEKMKARVEYDIYYIENWSLLLDLQVLVMTAFVVLLQKNAY